MTTEIPVKVQRKAQHLINRYGQNLDCIGNFNEYEYYIYKFPEETITGFPFVYAYNSETEEVMEISGSRALDIIGELTNN